MTKICKLCFQVTINIYDEDVDDLGDELAVFLNESWFNGEEVLDVEYKGHKEVC